MKRSKKIWIACGVFALIVVSCVLALSTRGNTYKFLGGARLDQMSIHSGGSFGEGYWIAGTPEAVAGRAKEELSSGLGWTWFYPEVGAYSAYNERDGTHLTIFKTVYISNGVPGSRLSINRDATLIDKVRVWFHER